MNDSPVFNADAKPTLISDQFKFTEGPAADSEGNIYFTDQPNNKIWKYDINNQLTVFVDDALRSNGMYVDKDGNVVACADEKGEIVAFGKDGSRKTLTARNDGARYNGPNDLWIDPQGGIYFTDPYYERDYWPVPKPKHEKENTWFLPAGAKDAFIADSSLTKPNGIIGTLDGKQLFIADIGGGNIYKFDIGNDGQLSSKTLFTNMGSDGVTLDERGDFYVTGKGVTIFNPQGKQIAHIPIDEDWTANLCFGGKSNDQLFITASKSLYVMPMLVKGLK